MDDLVTIPGTRIGIGMDALLGLVPGLGDLLGSTISGAIMVDAVRHRVPVRVLARMALNLILDALLGLVPVAGDLLDVAHRANRKNLRLLERSLERHPQNREPSVRYLVAAIGLVVLAVVGSIAIGVLALWLLVRALFG